MDLCKVWWLVVCAIYLLQLAELKVTNYLLRKSFRRIEEKEDDTIFLGLGSNPFGPSMKFIPGDEQSPTNMSLPNHVDSNSVEIVDTGQDQEVSLGKKQGRSKRGVFHLYNMVKCATGCDPIKYKGYGCYCGFLGSGRPVDPIDRCCKKHDWCYDNAGCPPFFEYLQPYYWKCWNGRPLCAIEHGEFGGRGSCARRLCECDRVLSECLARYHCPKTRALCVSSPWRLIQNTFMIL